MLLFRCFGISGSSLLFKRCHWRRPSSSSSSSIGVSMTRVNHQSLIWNSFNCNSSDFSSWSYSLQSGTPDWLLLSSGSEKPKRLLLRLEPKEHWGEQEVKGSKKRCDWWLVIGDRWWLPCSAAVCWFFSSDPEPPLWHRRLTEWGGPLDLNATLLNRQQTSKKKNSSGKERQMERQKGNRT